MMLKKYFKSYSITIILIFLISVAYIKANSAKPPTLNEVIDHIYSLIELKNYNQISKKYIHKKYGFVLLYRLGVYDNISIEKSLTSKKAKNILNASGFFHVTKKTKKIRWRDVQYSCETETWSENGFFLQKIPKATIVKQVLKVQKQFFPSSKKIAHKSFFENNLYHFVDTLNDIDIYLKFIDGRWYIVIIDLVSSDCSA